MEHSILNDIKKLIGLSPDYTPFDADIITFINTALGTIYHVGFTDREGPFMITDANTVWEEIAEDPHVIELLKSYVYLKTRLLFDPPASSVILEANKECIKELEWRISSLTDYEILPDDPDRDLWVHGAEGIVNG